MVQWSVPQCILCSVYLSETEFFSHVLHRTVKVSKLQQLGKISFAEMSLRKAMKELQENSSKLAQLFRRGLVVALPSLFYHLHFVTHFAGKVAPNAFT